MRRVRLALVEITDAASSPVNVIGTVAAVALVIVLVLIFFQFRTSDELAMHVDDVDRQGARVETVADQNRRTTCSIARLVAYVPAMQFEGEPLENFLNWISARRALLLEAQQCDPTVEAILRERVAQDQKLLDELKTRP